MLRRFSLAGIALVTTLVAYQLYVLALVPLLEPPVVQHASNPATEEEWSRGRAALGRYQRLLADYFPAGHWALAGTPKVIENGQLMLVLEKYEPDDRGGVRLGKCAMLGFPTPRQQGGPSPIDAVVLEAPGGGQLQFDDAFNPARGKIGRLIGGFFPGELVIRSRMRDPGPEDDLHIVTRDLRIKESLLYSDAEVNFRLGPHHASGRQLEVRLVREEHLKPGASGLSIAGVESLEVRESVEAELQMPVGSMGIGSEPQDNVAMRSVYGRPEPVRLTSATSQPLRITSRGPFRFDFTRFTASFQQEVTATLPHAEGPSDQLHCTELLLHFGRHEGSVMTLTPADEPELAKQQGRALGNLKPYLLEAVGNPVRLDAPGAQAAVRGRRLRAWIGERRVRVDGSPATIAHGLNEARAAWIDYQMPPEDSSSPVGPMTMAGPGWIRVTPKQGQPERMIEARWAEPADGGPAVRLAHDRAGQPVLSISGRPEIASSLLGRIVSDTLRIRLREVAPDGPEGPAIEMQSPDQQDAESMALLPERIDAEGNIEFRGRELVGKTNTLVAWFRPQAARVDPPTSHNRLGSSNRPAGPAKRSYRLSADQVQLEVGLFGRRADPMGLLCTGQVRFEEATEAGAQPGLRVVGEELRVEGLHEPGVRLTVAGLAEGRDAPSGSGGSERRGLAQISGRGMRLWASELHADQSHGQVWVDGPGDARLELSRKKKQGPLGQGPFGSMQGEATLRWKGGMRFDGSRIELRDEVFAESAEGWVRCNRLAANLSRPIDLSGKGSQLEGAAEVAEIECLGGVSIDHRSSDAGGQRSHARARMASLKINRLSGEISGSGPGWVRSVHLADGDWSDLAGSKATAGRAAPTTAGGAAPTTKAKLHFMRINFQRGLSGNLNARALRFHERVRGVYGPVLAWDQELPINAPGGPAPETALLECDELRVHEDPSARLAGGGENRPMGPIELRALGAVRLEGSSGEEKVTHFTAEATSASYTQLKEVFVLEGNAQRGVNIWVQQDPSRPPARSVAGKITYDLRLGQVTKVEDIRAVDYRTAQPGSRRSR